VFLGYMTVQACLPQAGRAADVDLLS